MLLGTAKASLLTAKTEASPDGGSQGTRSLLCDYLQAVSY